MTASTTGRATFLCYLLGSKPLPKVSEFFKTVYRSTPDAVGLFTGPSDTWEGASINHVLFRRIRAPMSRLPEEVQRAAEGRPAPHFVLEASSSVNQPEDMASFITGNLLAALADRTAALVVDPHEGLLYTGEPASPPPRKLPWNHLNGAPDPEADDWSDVL